MISHNESWVLISLARQKLEAFEGGSLVASYAVSTAKNGAGEMENSECTPRGWHAVVEKIGAGMPLNTAFRARQPETELCTEQNYRANPNRDWILTRIIRLDGLESGRNRGGQVDSFARYIYIHGSPDAASFDKPGSRGCIRMRNPDIVQLFDWLPEQTRVLITEG